MPDPSTLRRGARALGWTSFVLGGTELLGANWLCAQLGIARDRASLVRALGAREVASGAGVLAADDPTAGVWARVAGDAIDLALLGVAAARSRRKGAVGVAAVLVAGITALDVYHAVALQREAPAT